MPLQPTERKAERKILVADPSRPTQKLAMQDCDRGAGLLFAPDFPYTLTQCPHRRVQSSSIMCKKTPTPLRVTRNGQ